MDTNIILREALGVDADFAFTDEQIAQLRHVTRDVTPYVILFTARSGSTFLTHEIANAEVLGVPNEWFSWLYARADTKEFADTPFDFITRLVTRRKSSQNIFGVETNRLMLELFEDIIPLQTLFVQRPRWFFLRRRNLVMQSISNYFADSTQIFHSYQVNENSHDRQAMVAYDADKLRSYIQNFVAEEIWCMQRFAKMDVMPVHLYYEDITSAPKVAPKMIANVLGTQLPAQYLEGDIANNITRLANDRNRAFERRFREEEQAFLNEMLQQRPRVLAPAQSI